MKKSFWAYIKRYKFKSVFIRYIFLLAIFVLVPVQVFMSVYQNCYYTLIRQEISATSESYLKKMEYMLDTLMQNIDRQALLVSNNNEIRKFAITEETYNYTYDHEQIEQTLEQFNLGLDEISSIYVYSEKSGYIFSTVSGGYEDTFFDNGWIDEYELRKNEGSWISLREIYDMSQLQNMEYLTLFRTIEVYNQSYGVLVININADVLKERYLNINNAEVGISIYNPDNQCLLSVGNTLAEPQSLREQLDKTGEHLITYDAAADDDKRTVLALRSSYTDWLLVCDIDLTYLESNLGILNFIKYFTILIYLGVSFIIIYIFIKWIMIPVSRILDSLNLSYNEATEVYTGDDSENEMMLIKKTLQHSTQMKDELRLKINNLKAAQFAMLQSQISPHFLINTLSSAYWYMIRQSNGKTPVTELLSSLTSLIQNTFSTQENFWDIREELEHLEKFIKVQKFRFGDNVTVNITSDPDISDCKMIRLVLQPVVENAFQHGLMHRSGDLIDVKCERQDNDIVFEVYDNGCGISNETIEKITSTHLEDGKYVPLHGLKNVDYRIKLLFGNSYGVTIEQPEAGGTLIRIRIPRMQG